MNTKILDNRYLNSLKIVSITCLGCIIATIVAVIQMSIINSDLVIMNPITSGYLHSGLEHFGLNVIMLFLVLLPDVNRKIGFLNIFFITTFISLLYLPVEILGLTQNAIGISGTCCFLLSRYFFSWKNKKWLGSSIILLFASFEFFQFFDPSDNSAHGVHLIGILLGCISLKIQVPIFISDSRS